MDGEAKYQYKNGKWYCSKYIAQCPEVKRRNSERNKELYINGRKSPAAGKPSWNKGLTKETSERVAKSVATLKSGFETGRLISHRKGKPHTIEEKKKISESRKRYLQEHPDKVPYLLNHSSKMSYPEQYFKELFEKEQIPLLYHKQIGIYQLDFYNEDLMKYVEIDGETHSLENVKKIDARRDKYLKDLGWSGIRIKWSSYQKMNEEEKHLIISNIKEFLN